MLCSCFFLFVFFTYRMYESISKKSSSVPSNKQETKMVSRCFKVLRFQKTIKKRLQIKCFSEALPRRQFLCFRNKISKKRSALFITFIAINMYGIKIYNLNLMYSLTVTIVIKNLYQLLNFIAWFIEIKQNFLLK